jgi:hypothetical protein
MYVAAIHSISDPKAFWGGQLDLPQGTTISTVVPNQDGTRGICIFESDSLDTVRTAVDRATRPFSSNEYFAVNEQNAQGLAR